MARPPSSDGGDSACHNGTQPSPTADNGARRAVLATAHCSDEAKKCRIGIVKSGILNIAAEIRFASTTRWPPMTPADLQRALHAVEPAAVLVAPRVLENMVREAGHLSGLMWRVPHRASFIVDRQTLFRHVEQEELALGPDQLLPVTVMLLAWPEAEELEAANSGPLLRKYWQWLFHISVHMHLENLWAEGKLTAAGIRERIERLGPTRVEEIRLVLVQDHYLPPEPDQPSVYIE